MFVFFFIIVVKWYVVYMYVYICSLFNIGEILLFVIIIVKLVEVLVRLLCIVLGDIVWVYVIYVIYVYNVDVGI